MANHHQQKKQAIDIWQLKSIKNIGLETGSQWRILQANKQKTHTHMMPFNSILVNVENECC